MRYLAIALLSVGILSPLSAAQGSAAHHTMLVKARKNKSSKFKPHKAPKPHARKANRAN